MSEKHHKSILLTNPDGFQSHLFEPSTSDTNDVTNIEHIVPADEPEPITSNDFDTSSNNNNNKIGGVQFDSEQIERGRSRIMKRDIAIRNDSSGSRSNGNGSGSENRTSLSRSRSRSRSMSRSRSRIREEEFLKWTVLRQDPSMRLYNVKRKNIKKQNNKKEDEEEDSEEEGEVNKDEEEDEEEEEEEEEEESEEEESEESDEEQVSDIEDDAEIDSKFDYDPGMKVLPNFVVSINDVLESKKPWINKFKNNDEYLNIEKDIKLERMDEGYIRGLKLLSKKLPEETPVADTLNQQTEGNCYILYVDMTSESMYALTYVMGTIVNNGDTLYIVQWESSSVKVNDKTIKENIIKISENCYHLFDCISGVIDTLDIIILSLTHPYPKHLLNEMITTLKPQTLCCSLSMILSGLQNFVCGVPTLVIRKKLKRTKKKGIME